MNSPSPETALRYALVGSGELSEACLGHVGLHATLASLQMVVLAKKPQLLPVFSENRPRALYVEPNLAQEGARGPM